MNVTRIGRPDDASSWRPSGHRRRSTIPWSGRRTPAGFMPSWPRRRRPISIGTASGRATRWTSPSRPRPAWSRRPVASSSNARGCPRSTSGPVPCEGPLPPPADSIELRGRPDEVTCKVFYEIVNPRWGELRVVSAPDGVRSRVEPFDSTTRIILASSAFPSSPTDPSGTGRVVLDVNGTGETIRIPVVYPACSPDQPSTDGVTGGASRSRLLREDPGRGGSISSSLSLSRPRSQ